MHQFVRDPYHGLWVGQIVHYVAYGTPGGEYPAGVCRAAIVTECPARSADEAPLAGLCVLNPTGVFFNRSVPYSAEYKPGTWHHRDQCPHA